MKSEILQDVKSNGKQNPWRDKKMGSMKLANSYKRLGWHTKSMRTRYCGSILEFGVHQDTGKKKLIKAQLCKDPLCPMCQWRKSKRMFSWLSQILDYIEETHSDLVPVFLTLTLKNCEADKLDETLQSIFTGWQLLVKRRSVARLMKGWFRAVEIKYNSKTKEFHPHVHIIFLVDRGYFKSPEYTPTRLWAKLWGASLCVDYDPVVWIEMLQNTKGSKKGIKEVSKYVVKESDFLFRSNKLTDKIISALAPAIKGHRMYAFGGLMAKVKKELGLTLESKEHPDEIREDIATLIEVYRWNMGLSNYVRMNVPA